MAFYCPGCGAALFTVSYWPGGEYFIPSKKVYCEECQKKLREAVGDQAFEEREAIVAEHLDHQEPLK